MLTSLITRIELQDGFFVCFPKHLARKTQNAGGFADTRHAGDDDVRHVALSCDNLETLNGLGVAHDIIKKDRSVLLDPVPRFRSARHIGDGVHSSIPWQLVGSRSIRRSQRRFGRGCR